MDELVQVRRDTKKQGWAPRRMITDKLGSYAENSHVPLRKRERARQGFRSPGGLQRFVAIFSVIRNLFVPLQSRRSALAIYLHRLDAMAHWKAVAGDTA